MRLVLTVCALALALAGCAASPALPASGDAPSAPEAARLTCEIDGVALDVDALFDPTPTDWVPLARRLLTCSPEVVAALGIGPPDADASTAAVTTYRRRIANRGRVLVLAYEASGVVGVSVGEDVPERLTETVFDLRSVQAREAAGGQSVPSPPGTLVFPATEGRPYGVRLVTSPPLLVLSVVRE